MAEILIKNIEMPTNEDEALVLVLYENGRVRKALDYNIIALSKETTTAKELPPHGDLMDRKDVFKKLYHEINDVSPLCDVFEIVGILREIPVVIPASKE